MRALLLLALLGCDASVAVTDTPDAEPDCLPAQLELQRAEDCYDDEAACPQDVPERPWEATCGRAYVCEYRQPDGSWAWVCTRARDCGCLEAWAGCTGDDVPVPAYCVEG